MKVTVDFAKKAGEIKPMNCVNNAPVWKFTNDQNISNMDTYRAARIPYARTHDSSIDYFYGGEHIIDVHLIFTDFDADEYDPASYDFQLTDEFLRRFEVAGTKVFYRLGSKIEHWSKKYGTLPPKDFKKWAVVCEHIIAHVNEGWADGTHLGVEYWEIWNEPDGASDDAPNKQCWGGTRAQFYEFYAVAAAHLKNRFPALKIGGPAVCGYNPGWDFPFLDYLREHGAPLDFFSWHRYDVNPDNFVKSARDVRRMLDDHGFERTESILNEWNYVKGFDPPRYIPSILTVIGLKGAAFSTAVMCACQDAPLDMLMYYDARPCVLNGMFDMYTKRPLKGYYPFKLWSDLADLGSEAETKIEGENVYSVSAFNSEGETLTLVCYFTDLEDQPDAEIALELKNKAPGECTVMALDEAHNFEPVLRAEPDAGKLKLTLRPNTVVAVK